MSRRVQIDQLADAVMRELENYADTTTDGVKGAVKKAANTVKKEITAGAPARSGKYVGYVYCVQGKTFFGSKNLNGPKASFTAASEIQRQFIGELFPVHYHPKYPKIHWPELSDAMPGYRIW